MKKKKTKSVIPKVKEIHETKGHDHSAIMPAVRRATGQLQGVEKMIRDGRYCPDILTQIRAVRAALRSLETKILEGHLNSCVKQCFASKNESDKELKIKEVLELFKNS